jgi:hypothetical protein
LVDWVVFAVFRLLLSTVALSAAFCPLVALSNAFGSRRFLLLLLDFTPVCAALLRRAFLRRGNRGSKARAAQHPWAHRRCDRAQSDKMIVIGSPSMAAQVQPSTPDRAAYRFPT